MTFSHDGFRDSLTHFAAPPYFYEYLTRELAKYERKKSNFTAVRILLPLDSLYEEHILNLSHAISLSIRPQDIAARMGENEFVVIFTEIDHVPTDLHSRILQALRESQAPLLQYSLSETVVLSGDTPQSFLDRLDRAPKENPA